MPKAKFAFSSKHKKLLADALKVAGATSRVDNAVARIERRVARCEKTAPDLQYSAIDRYNSSRSPMVHICDLQEQLGVQDRRIRRSLSKALTHVTKASLPETVNLNAAEDPLATLERALNHLFAACSIVSNRELQDIWTSGATVDREFRKLCRGIESDWRWATGGELMAVDGFGDWKPKVGRRDQPIHPLDVIFQTVGLHLFPDACLALQAFMTGGSPYDVM